MDTFTTDVQHHSVVGIVVKIFLAIGTVALIVLGVKTYRKLKEKGGKPTVQTIKDAAKTVVEESVSKVVTHNRDTGNEQKAPAEVVTPSLVVDRRDGKCAFVDVHVHEVKVRDPYRNTVHKVKDWSIFVFDDPQKTRMTYFGFFPTETIKWEGSYAEGMAILQKETARGRTVIREV